MGGPNKGDPVQWRFRTKGRRDTYYFRLPLTKEVFSGIVETVRLSMVKSFSRRINRVSRWPFEVDYEVVSLLSFLNVTVNRVELSRLNSMWFVYSYISSRRRREQLVGVSLVFTQTGYRFHVPNPDKVSRRGDGDVWEWSFQITGIFGSFSLDGLENSCSKLRYT